MTERTLLAIVLNVLVVVALLVGTAARVLATTRAAHRSCLTGDDHSAGCRERTK